MSVVFTFFPPIISSCLLYCTWLFLFFIYFMLTDKSGVPDAEFSCFLLMGGGTAFEKV